MGPCPDGFSIDRKDSDEDYNPENCRWADALTQAQNKTNNVIIEIDGEKKILAEWARISGVNQRRISKRLRSGWDPKHAVFDRPQRSGS
jgi:hypothetical protein